MSINLQYGIFPGSKVAGPIGTNEGNLLCVDGNQVLFLSGFIYGESDLEIGKLLTQAMIRIIIHNKESGYTTIRVVNLLKTIEGASIVPLLHDPKLRGHLLVEHIRRAALDHVRSLCRV